MQVDSNVGTNSFRQKGVDLIIERESNFLKELESFSSELEPLPTMVDEKRDLVGASDEENNILETAIIIPPGIFLIFFQNFDFWDH